MLFRSISILYSLVWGILGILFTEKLHPFVRKKIEKISLAISKTTQRIIVNILVILFVIDEFSSILAYLS